MQRRWRRRKKKINKYTKILTVVFALIEGIGLYLSYKSSGIFRKQGFSTGALVVISLMAGTALLMWLGDQITKKGIGNGISIIIFVGIISGLTKCSDNYLEFNLGTGTFSTTGLLMAH